MTLDPPHSAHYISNIGSPFTFGPLHEMVEGSAFFYFPCKWFSFLLLLSLFVIPPPPPLSRSAMKKEGDSGATC